MKENHRRPSKHRLEEHDMLNWYKHTKKMIARGDYPADRIAKFKILQDIADEYRRLNQYILEKPSVFDPRGQSDVAPRKLFYFDPSKVLTGGGIFILPCLLLGLHLSDAFAEEFDTV